MSWLESVKPGDEAVILVGGWWSEPRIVRVDRVTVHHVIVGAQKFRRKCGYLAGTSGFQRARIGPVEQTHRDMVENGRLRRRIEAALSDQKLPLSTLRAMAQALEPTP